MMTRPMSDREPPAIVCDRIAIPLQDRMLYRSLRRRLANSLEFAREIQDGYIFEFHTESISANEITNWIHLERMCCPWISIQMRRIRRNRIAIYMLIPEQAKNVLRVEFSDWEIPKRG